MMLEVDLVLNWWVEVAEWRITGITNPEESLRLLATVLLHDIIIRSRSSDLQLQRERINDMLRQKIDRTSCRWGIFTEIEISDIKLPPEITSLMQLYVAADWKRRIAASEAETYVEAQKKRAAGDSAALEILSQVAAKVDNKMLLLRYFEMLKELGKSPSTKFVLPVELIDLARPYTNILKLEEVLHPNNQPNSPTLNHP
jgi:regulator of protease activity HflC (stomatin/prohibitin superfamily)